MKRPKIKTFKKVVEQCNGNITAIAQNFDVYRTTVYDWCDSNPEFAKCIEEYRGRLVDRCMKTAELLSCGVPIIEDNKFQGWKERPDGNMLRYLLGVFGKREGFTNDINLATRIDYTKLTDSQIENIASQMMRSANSEEKKK